MSLTFIVLQQQQNLGRIFGTSKMQLSRPMALAAVRFKAVVLLLLIRCGLLPPMRDSVIVLDFVLHYSILVCNHPDGDKRTSCFALFVLLVSPDCCVVFPHNVKVLSAVCDCGIILTMFGSKCTFINYIRLH